jgi:uncharacterized protein (TIGR03437 family)
MNYEAGFDHAVAARTGVGSINRRFQLPIELSGISLTINGAACGLKSVSRHRIVFVVPPALPVASGGSLYKMNIFNNGTEMTTNVTIVPAQPDIFSLEGTVGPGGRTKIFNVTNRVITGEPFTVTSISVRPFGRVPTVLRLYLTGAANITPSNTVIRIGGFGSYPTPLVGNAVLVEPGIYTVDFTLPPQADGAGDQPIVLSVTIDGVVYSSRLDDTATMFRIL